MHQLSLNFLNDEDNFRDGLESRTGKRISLVITDNTSSMLSFRTEKNRVHLRLHNMFLDAGNDVVDEMAGFINSQKRKTPLINDFIKRNRYRLKQKSRRILKVLHRGKYHDLLEAFNKINNDYFEGRIRASITWGAKGPKRAAAKRTLGSYCMDNSMIRINPILDSKKVPRYFLEYIVYHEMLHADIGIEAGKRRRIHSGEFRRREKLFEYYEKALAWERKRWGQ